VAVGPFFQTEIKIMTNENSLKIVESAVTDCEAELARLDQLARQIESSKAAIQKLGSDNQDIRDDVDADAKKRATALTTNAAQLDLAQGDLRSLERNLETQRKRVAEIGKIALSRIMQTWSAIHQHCKAAAETEIRQSYDVGRLLMPIDLLAAARLDVLMSKQMQDRLFSVQFDPAAMMLELRRIRERFQQVSDAVANEPDLILRLARSEEPAAVKHEPAAAELVAA
jgi:hypothetical protein